MKAFRIALLVAAAVAASSTIAGAQGASSTRPQQEGAGAGRRGMNAAAGIEFTEDQKVRLAEIQKKYAPEMMAIRELMQNGGDRAELMKKSLSLREKSNVEIRAILTADQQAIFDANMVQMKTRMERMTQRQATPQR